MRGRKDVTTLVTGASAGIGKEIARLAAADSKRIVLVARRRPLLDELAAELVEAIPDLLTSVVVCDLAEETSRRELLATLEKDRIAVDHLVNNAGFGDAGPFADYDADRHVRMVDVNVAAGRGYEETRLRRSGAVSASSVANAGYRAMLAGRRVVVPGLMNRLMRRVVPFVPRRLLLAVTERMMEPRRST